MVFKLDELGVCWPMSLPERLEVHLRPDVNEADAKMVLWKNFRVDVPLCVVVLDDKDTDSCKEPVDVGVRGTPRLDIVRPIDTVLVSDWFGEITCEQL